MKCTPTQSFHKTLPWLARKAGVTPARAEALWRKAECFANRLTRPGTAAWSRLAMTQLAASLEAERSHDARHAGLNALWLLPARLWLLGAEAAERTTLALNVAWRTQRPIG